MDLSMLFNMIALAAFVVVVLSSLGLVVLLFLYLAKRRKTRRPNAKSSDAAKKSSVWKPSRSFFSFSGSDDKTDITTYATRDIPRSGLFSSYERKIEYRRRGKSPSGVIDGVYNDMNREDGHSYNDMDRDWDADA